VTSVAPCEMYTQVTKKDIYRDRGIFGLLLGADSLSDTAPLQALIAKHITAETLERVAAAYDDLISDQPQLGG